MLLERHLDLARVDVEAPVMITSSLRSTKVR